MSHYRAMRELFDTRGGWLVETVVQATGRTIGSVCADCC